MNKIDANGTTLAYQRSGAGHPLLLISGVGYGAWYWHTLVPLLTDHYEVIVFDNRGTGDSDKPPGPYTVDMLAADTAALLDGLGISGAYVLGHSLGGFIAQTLGVTRPDLVDKLILASTNHGGKNTIPITPEALAVMTDREGEPLELIRRGLALAAAPGWPDANPDMVQALIDYRLTGPVPQAQYTAQVMAGAGMTMLSDAQVVDRLAALTMPTLILFGEHDNVVPPGNARLMARKLPNTTVNILPELGHIFSIEDPQAAAQAIHQFLQTPHD